MTRWLAAVVTTAALVGVLGACGRYGPPKRIPVVVEDPPVAESLSEEEEGSRDSQ